MAHGLDEVGHAFARSAVEATKVVIEPEGIAFEEPREVGVDVGNFVFAKDLANERDIGAAVEDDVFGGFGQIEFGGEGFAESFDAGAPGANEGAIDVEEDEAYHGGNCEWEIVSCEFESVKIVNANPALVNADVVKAGSMSEAGFMGMAVEKHGRLEIDENFSHHVKGWRLKRVAWALMGLIIAAALGGFLGTGPYSKRKISGAGGLQLEYERVARYNAPAHLFLTLPAGEEDLEVSLPLEFVKEIDLEGIDPEPKEMRLDGEKHTWIFPRKGSSSEIFIHYRPQGFGVREIEIDVKGAGEIKVKQFFMP